MPIIGKPLLVLGSLAGVSLLGTGGYFGISHLVSLNSQQPTESNASASEDVPVNGGLQGQVNSGSGDSQISVEDRDVTGGPTGISGGQEDLSEAIDVVPEGSGVEKTQTDTVQPAGDSSPSALPKTDANTVTSGDGTDTLETKAPQDSENADQSRTNLNEENGQALPLTDNQQSPEKGVSASGEISSDTGDSKGAKQTVISDGDSSVQEAEPSKDASSGSSGGVGSSSGLEGQSQKSQAPASTTQTVMAKEVTEETQAVGKSASVEGEVSSGSSSPSPAIPGDTANDLTEQKTQSESTERSLSQNSETSTPPAASSQDS